MFIRPQEHLNKLKIEKETSGRRSSYEGREECPNIITGIKHRTFWILLIFLTISSWSNFIFGMAYKELGFN